MEDMNAFERQVTDGLGVMGGPGRRIDAMAMTRSASTQPPKWRFQSMFSATKFVVAGAIVALFGGFLLAGVMTQPSDEVLPAVGASASPSPETAYVVSDISVAGLNVHRSMATDEALWVPHWDAHAVSRIDADTGEVTEVSDPTEYQVSDDIRWMVPTDDAIWAVDRDYIDRIDRIDLTVTYGTHRARGEPFMWEDDCFGPILADGSFWIASPGSTSHSLVEIDLTTGSIRDEYVADDDWSSNNSCPWMGVIGDAIWVHSTDPDGSGYRLTRFDLGTREFTDTIDGLPGGRQVRECCVVDDDAIWLMGSGSVSRFDVATHEVTDALDVGRDLRGGVATPGAIWVVGDSGFYDAVYRIDASALEVTDVIEVGENAEPPVLLHGAIWVANHGGRSVSRIDVESRQVTDTVAFPVNHLYPPLASDGVIWAYTEEGSLFRIDPERASK